nr:GNAT family N-acetyltransferase [uncultured Flavobacterium sp.]
MIEVKEIKSEKELIEFVEFPFKLYKNNKYWVPSIKKDELKSFNPNQDIFKTVDVKYYLAYKNNEIVGRVAAIINWTEVNDLNKRKARFGWLEMIDDIEVTEALLAKVKELAIENKLEYIEGPMGFSNMDKAGMLTGGFDQIATMIGFYNYEYYQKHLKQLGYKPEAEWIEYFMEIEKITETIDMTKISALIEKRYKVKSLEFNSIKDVLPYVDEMFQLLNNTYSELQSFVPIQQFQIDHYKDKYLNFIHPDFISCVVDEHGKLIAFGITMPSFSKAFQKTKGKIFPFGWWYLLQALKKNDHVEFYLIGVDPKYQNKGITALIFRDLHKSFKKRKIKTVETNPLLIENNKIQQLWQQFDPITHKERKTFRLDL